MAESRTSKLSRQQKAILLHLYRVWQEFEEWTPEWGNREREGIPWHTRGTRSGHASVSRALKRLEARGFLRRINSNDQVNSHPQAYHHAEWLRRQGQRRHTRTNRIILLPEGETIAKRLTTEKF